MVLEDATQKAAANLDAVLHAAGLSTKHIPTREAIESARNVMQEIMENTHALGVFEGYKLRDERDR